MEIPAILVFAAPIVSTPLSAWLEHDQFPRWANSVIAYLVAVLFALAWAALSNKLTGNLVADTMIIATYCVALNNTILQSMFQWYTVRLVSPLAVLARMLRPVIHVAVATPPATIQPPSTPLVPTPMSITSQATTPLPAQQSSPGTTWMASQVPPTPPRVDQAQALVVSSSPAAETPTPPSPATHDEQGS